MCGCVAYKSSYDLCSYAFKESEVVVQAECTTHERLLRALGMDGTVLLLQNL